MIQGNTIGIDEPQPPYGLSYTSSGRPLFATPFINSADGAVHVNPFPLTFPPLNATVKHPNPTIDYSPFLPQAGMTAPPPWNTYPYNENYFLSIERAVAADTRAEPELCRVRRRIICWWSIRRIPGIRRSAWH